MLIIKKPLFKSVPTYRNYEDYHDAEQALQTGDYELAQRLFKSAGNYQDAPQRVAEAEKAGLYASAVSLYDSGDYVKAAEMFHQVSNYQDADSRVLFPALHLRLPRTILCIVCDLVVLLDCQLTRLHYAFRTNATVTFIAQEKMP